MIVRSDYTRLASRRAVAVVALLTGALATIACERTVASVPQTQSANVDATAITRSTTSADSALGFPFVPDPHRTPGATLDVTVADICVSGYSKRARNVPAAVKRQAYASYGIRSHQPGDFEVDHLISLKLGGSNSIKNLWPESFRTQPWNAYVKDALEDELHRRVCAGIMDLAQAQHTIASNWVIGYRTYVHPNPLSADAPRKNRLRPRQQTKPRAQYDSPVP